jgi:hypothetical protein
MDSDVNSSSVGLFASDLVNVNDELLAVDAHHTAGISLEVSSGNSNLVLNSKNEQLKDFKILN